MKLKITLAVEARTGANTTEFSYRQKSGLASGDEAVFN
ncbi:Uncharacterised protein [Yersinia frederiksenii]|nr:Uncharacterised protein [Yersinia frederiksenii]